LPYSREKRINGKINPKKKDIIKITVKEKEIKMS